jgi:hypothetical protein
MPTGSRMPKASHLEVGVGVVGLRVAVFERIRGLPAFELQMSDASLWPRFARLTDRG